jgi:universal stress protein A
MNTLEVKTRPGAVTPSAEDQQDNADELVPAVIELKNILVPTDFSKISQKALEYALPFAKRFGAKITLLHVIEPLPYPVDLTFVPMGEAFPIHPIEEKLNALAKRLIDPELLKEVLVRIGPAFEVITNVARDCAADLIVITTHGRTGIRHVLMGSTAERVVRHSPCPVLVVRRHEHEFV